jgi:hypothetical protein
MLMVVLCEASKEAPSSPKEINEASGGQRMVTERYLYN